ncbi:Spo0E family sporulation regulatory protein-aspartic acid phosphatase [Paenibacillaceae bacterium WGS1546]|uniref:Spo0E family sporulation regulatory protein-aspartic acid phosphatase n=1 Tax=Cohnella sp. WGS1546 TaxID=3366810 RepID=UPI00372D5E5F
MAAAERGSSTLSSRQADTPIVSHRPSRAAELEREIDSLRQAMTDTFLQEHSLIAESVMQLSRQLDMKINEYMKIRA